MSVWLRITWSPISGGMGTYQTTERVDGDEPIQPFISGLKAAGAINAEIVKVKYNAQ